MRDWLLGEWTVAMWVNALLWMTVWLLAITVLVLALNALIPE